jgi:hypothetical protein
MLIAVWVTIERCWAYHAIESQVESKEDLMMNMVSRLFLWIFGEYGDLTPRIISSTIFS